MKTLTKKRVIEIRNRCKGKNRISLKADETLALTSMAIKSLNMPKKSDLKKNINGAIKEIDNAAAYIHIGLRQLKTIED